MKYLDKVKESCVIVLLPIISYLILGPLEIYAGNRKDFAFQYSDFFWIFLIIGVLLWIGISLLIATLPEKVNKYINAVILGIGVASYIQNMFMNIKLSENDGSPMRWEELKSFTIINLIIWIVILAGILALSIFLKKYWNYISIGAAGFLSLIQLVAVVSLLIPGRVDKEVSNLQMAGDEQFHVAASNNIIVFVLDTYGNVQYENTIQEFPEADDFLKDFTYYNNTDCHYYCTFPSMTHMLTGKEFEFDTSSEKWLSDAWNSEKANAFYEQLRNHGYTCNIYSNEVGYVYGDVANLYGKYDNIRPLEQEVDTILLVKRLGKMSIYRYVPYVLKPYFEVLDKDYSNVVSYKEGQMPIDDNAEFYSALTTIGLSKDTSMENALIIQHLFGTHLPYTTSETAQKVEESTAEETGSGLLTIVEEYLNQMKELGIYDNATIIITADHGSWYGGDVQPIFFIKQANEVHDEMRISTAPISLDDFQATILSIIDEDYTDYGTSIYDWNDGDERERHVYMRITDENYPDVAGSSFNVYYGYGYMTDKNELNEKVSEGPEEILPATTWE